MSFKRPLIINFKNYAEISGSNTIKLAHAALEVAKDTGEEIVLAPPQASLALIANSIKLPIVSQHLDDTDGGSTTGFFVPEIAQSYGAHGSILNHSEHRIEQSTVANLVKRMRNLGLISIVCVKSPEEVTEFARFEPDFIAIEPPELIGTGRAVSKENPSIIADSVKAAKGHNSRIICGAGISDRDDVSKAMELGAQGILVASSIVKAKSWKDKIAELASGMHG